MAAALEQKEVRVYPCGFVGRIMSVFLGWEGSAFFLSFMAAIDILSSCLPVRSLMIAKCKAMVAKHVHKS